MATTSPDNLRTPNPGDPYNLVPDLQTLANDVQAALNNKQSNVFKGTAAQRAAFLSTAVQGMLWQDTDGIKMLWRRDVSAWVPAVWRWAGTASQMNGFTQAPNGFEWFNTTDNSKYVRLGGAWSKVLEPKASASGYVAAVGAVNLPITFPVGLFSVKPNILVSKYGTLSTDQIVAANATATGFDIRHTGTSGTFQAHWFAVAP